jgi:radical SAM superfamily enzyme YgiQ (UPF0313 family)
MKIGFLAMSGLRAHDPALLQLGLTLPGVVERGNVVASMPCLGLLWIAALTPTRHDVCYFEADNLCVLPDALFECDLVAVSALSAQASEACQVAGRLRERGIRTALGGLHATVCPDEVQQFFDFVFVGEAENTWPAALAEIERGARSGIWRAADYPPVDIDRLPAPRYDLLQDGHWNRFPVQTTRGCPWRCDFCASSIMLERPYRKRRIVDVIRDIRAVKKLRRRPFIELADDNTFVDKRWGRELCHALAGEKIRWFTETDITVAEDEELLRLLRAARCRQLLIGLESPAAADLSGIELKADFKARSAGGYMEAVRRIQDAGVTVNGCFVLGLDHHGPDIFDRILAFAMETPLYEVQVTVMTPFPGTPLYQRLLDDDRILEPGRWDLCTLFDINYQPLGMSVEQLRQGMFDLVSRLYSAECIAARRRPVLEHLWRKGPVPD